MTRVPLPTTEYMSAKVNYDKVVLTTIDVVSAPTEENPKRVTFSDLSQSKKNDDDAIFIHNIREVSRGPGVGWDTKVDFEADSLTYSEALEIVDNNSAGKKVLFVIHGFGTEGSFHLVDCKNVTTHYDFTKIYIIPVIWPSLGSSGIFDYFDDRKYSREAGRALKSIKKPIEGFTASIAMHSMGNRVFRYMADSDFNFDNIFLVAADVDRDIFDENYISGRGEEHQHGLSIKSCLKDETGKIHVIYNKKDSKLFQSKFFNFKRRLGATPLDVEKSVHKDLKDVLVNIDASNDGISHKKMLYENAKEHNYHFFTETAKYYDENA